MKKWLSSVKDWYVSNDRYSRNQRSSTPSLPHAPSGSCLGSDENKGKLVFYAGMDKVKFKKQVVPGDQLVMTATFVKRRGTIAVVEAKAEVDGKLAASGTLTFAIGN